MTRLLKAIFFILLTVCLAFCAVSCGDERPDDDGKKPDEGYKEPTYYQITYENFGSTTATTATEGSILFEIEHDERIGFVFDGWYDGEKKWDFSKDKVYKDVCLYAKYTPIEYKIVCEIGLGEKPTEIIYTVLSESVLLPTPSLSGYDFLGWIKEGSSETEESVTVTVSEDSLSDMKYIARWKKHINMMYFVTNGGEEIESRIFVPNSPLPDAEREGYTFGGWFSDKDLTQPALVAPERSTTLYARWTEEASPALLDYAIVGSEEDSVEIRGKLSALPKDLVIPSYIGGLPVTEICSVGDSSEVRSLTLPRTVARIERGALSGLSNITEITVPFVGEAADGSKPFVWFFGGEYFFDSESYIPKSLKKVTVTDSDIPYQAFHSAKYIESVSLLFEGMESVPNNAFYECESLKEVFLPSGVESVGDHAFGGCFSLERVPLPESVKTIGEYAFERCTSLVSITLPESLESIGPSAFGSCKSLTELTIPENVSEIGSSAFSFCGSLRVLDIGDGVRTIGSSAFYACYSLMSASIGKNVTSIGNQAFFCCYTLAEIINRSDLTFEMGSESAGYVARYAVKIHSSERTLSSFENAYYIEEGGVYYLVGLRETGAFLVLPDTLAGNNYRLIPELFRDREEIISVTVGAGVEFIGDYAFDGCDRIVEVINRSSLEITNAPGYSYQHGGIGENALEVHLGESKIKLSDNLYFYTFDGKNYCVGLKDAVEELVLPERYNGETYVIGDYAFYYFEWREALRRVVISSGVTEIGYAAFQSCGNLTSLEIAEGTEAIGAYAFSGCDLFELIIPDSVKTIGSRAFYYKMNLEKVYIGRGVETIDEGAFNSCPKLSEVYYGKSESEFSDIVIGNNNSALTYATFTYNYDINTQR